MIEIEAEDVDAEVVPSFRPHVFAVEVDDEIILLDETQLLLHVMNAPASVVVAQFDRTRTVAEIAQAISTTFQADLQTVRADVLTLVRQLGRLGLLTGVRGQGLEEPHNQ